MSSVPDRDRRPLFTRAFGLRIALWYATLFVVGSMVIVLLTYYLTAVSLSPMSPIRQLTRAVRRIIRTGRTDTRVPLSGSGDALDELTTLFNTMLDRIERLVTAMHGSLDNVSHDLRTPLTRLRGAAEMALAAPPDLDRYREALADTIEESDRVLGMLKTLMDISAVEYGALTL